MRTPPSFPQAWTATSIAVATLVITACETTASADRRDPPFDSCHGRELPPAIAAGQPGHFQPRKAGHG